VSKTQTSLDYLTSQLPERRKRYSWAPQLYSVELAHIDAITKLVDWATDSEHGEGGLTDVLDTFAGVYGWPNGD